MSCFYVDTYKLLAEGPGCTPTVYLTREYSPLKCALTMDILICESLLVWVEVMIAIVDHT